MIIPVEIFNNMDYFLPDWRGSYQMCMDHNRLSFVYLGKSHAEFLGIPEEPDEKDYDPQHFEGVGKEEALEMMREDWQIGVAIRITEYLGGLSGDGYEVELLGDMFDSQGFFSEGFLFIIHTY